MYGERFPRFCKLLPTPLRLRFWLSRVNRRTFHCDASAIDVAMSHFAGYNNLPVCAEHFQSVELSNKIDIAMKRGDL